MSKRFIQQDYSERKKAKLDISFSNHNLPSRQNFGSGKESIPANWGDDSDDEFLLLASQMCEDPKEFNDQNISNLPNYSMCMQPSLTSTQVGPKDPRPSTSIFPFKKPISNPINAISTNGRISSPLPGLSKAIHPVGVNVSNDIIINYNKDQNLDNIYRQLLQLQEENAKLKSENGQLQEKCMTKEGESSVLRTQLKTCQAAVDNVKVEKIKALEKIEIAWSEKLTAANTRLDDLKTQLDFKNLEVMSTKEKCKMLESNRIKLTQVTIPANDISMTQRQDNVKVKTISISAQTEKSHFIRLTIPQRQEQSRLSKLIPLVSEPISSQYSILEYNEKLKLQTNTQNQYRIFNTFHNPASTSINVIKKKEFNLNRICEDLSCLDVCKDGVVEKYINIFKLVKEVISEVRTELETIRQRMTTAFQKEMDEKYIDVTSKILVVNKQDLLSGRALYKEEQGVLARKLVTVLAYLPEYSVHQDIVNKLLVQETEANGQTDCIVADIYRICELLDGTTCAVLYSGLIQSIIYLLEKIYKHIEKKLVLQIIKNLILSRPRLFVSCRILEMLPSIEYLKTLCSSNASGNLKVDYDQGVLLYNKESCALEVLVKQIEVALKCIDRQQLPQQAVDVTSSVIMLYNCLRDDSTALPDKKRCECQLSVMQVMVYGLRICSHFMVTAKCNTNDRLQTEIQSVCLSGTTLVYQRVSRDVEFLSQLGDSEGHLLVFCEKSRDIMLNDLYSNMLSEITSALLSVEEKPKCGYMDAWLAELATLTVAE